MCSRYTQQIKILWNVGSGFFTHHTYTHTHPEADYLKYCYRFTWIVKQIKVQLFICLLIVVNVYYAGQIDSPIVSSCQITSRKPPLWRLVLPLQMMKSITSALYHKKYPLVYKKKRKQLVWNWISFNYERKNRLSLILFLLIRFFFFSTLYAFSTKYISHSKCIEHNYTHFYLLTLLIIFHSITILNLFSLQNDYILSLIFTFFFFVNFAITSIARARKKKSQKGLNSNCVPEVVNKKEKN